MDVGPTRSASLTLPSLLVVMIGVLPVQTAVPPAMTDIIAQLGAILLNLGAFSALFLIAPVLYGLVVVMRRWWLVLATALLLGGFTVHVATHDVLVEAARSLPAAMVPATGGYLAVVLGYILLAVAMRLATLRLEWRGVTRRTIGDIHVLGFLIPTVAAFVTPFVAA